VPLFGAPSFRSGGSLEAFTPASLEPAASDAARRARIADIAARFDRFADGFAARDPAHPDVLADMRYSIGTTDFRPLWGIRLNPAPGGEPVAWVDLVNIRDAARRRLLGDGKRD
jgi:hypothetical protein